jgi:hypothetical protein
MNRLIGQTDNQAYSHRTPKSIPIRLPIREKNCQKVENHPKSAHIRLLKREKK